VPCLRPWSKLGRWIWARLSWSTISPVCYHNFRHYLDAYMSRYPIPGVWARYWSTTRVMRCVRGTFFLIQFLFIFLEKRGTYWLYLDVCFILCSR
jgi:hypothetical protein